MRPPWFSKPARTARTAAEVDLDRDVADQPRAGLADGVERGDAEALDPLVAELVGGAEQLVAAADGEPGHARRHGRLDGVALRCEQVGGDHPLVAVLAAADVDQVVRVGVERLAHPGRGVAEADSAPLAAVLEEQDVAAVGVDVHLVRVEGQQSQLSHRAPP